MRTISARANRPLDVRRTVFPDHGVCSARGPGSSTWAVDLARGGGRLLELRVLGRALRRRRPRHARTSTTALRLPRPEHVDRGRRARAAALGARGIAPVRSHRSKLRRALDRRAGPHVRARPRVRSPLAAGGHAHRGERRCRHRPLRAGLGGPRDPSPHLLVRGATLGGRPRARNRGARPHATHPRAAPPCPARWRLRGRRGHPHHARPVRARATLRHRGDRGRRGVLRHRRAPRSARASLAPPDLAAPSRWPSRGRLGRGAARALRRGRPPPPHHRPLHGRSLRARGSALGACARIRPSARTRERDRTDRPTRGQPGDHLLPIRLAALPRASTASRRRS